MTDSTGKNAVKTATIFKTHTSSLSNSWLFSENAQKNVWYVAVYLGDKIPYVIKFDGRYWRDRDNKVIAIPMRIKDIGELPKERDETQEIK